MSDLEESPTKPEETKKVKSTNKKVFNPPKQSTKENTDKKAKARLKSGAPPDNPFDVQGKKKNKKVPKHRSLKEAIEEDKSMDSEESKEKEPVEKRIVSQVIDSDEMSSDHKIKAKKRGKLKDKMLVGKDEVKLGKDREESKRGRKRSKDIAKTFQKESVSKGSEVKRKDKTHDRKGRSATRPEAKLGETSQTLKGRLRSQTPTKMRSRSHKKKYIVPLAIEDEDMEVLEKMAKQLGRSVQIIEKGGNISLMTHLVVDQDRIFRKYVELTAIVNGAYIVTKDWVYHGLDSKDADHLPKEENYEVKYIPSKAKRDAKPLFEGEKFYFYRYEDLGGVITVGELMDFVHCLGGKVLRLPEPGCIVIADLIYSHKKDFVRPQNIKEAPYEDELEDSEFEGEEGGGKSDSDEEESKERPKNKKSKHVKRKTGLGGARWIDMSRAKMFVNHQWIPDSIIYFEKQKEIGYRTEEVDHDLDDIEPDIVEYRSGEMAKVRKKKPKPREVSVIIKQNSLAPPKSEKRMSSSPKRRSASTPRASQSQGSKRGSQRSAVKEGPSWRVTGTKESETRSKNIKTPTTDNQRSTKPLVSESSSKASPSSEEEETPKVVRDRMKMTSPTRSLKGAEPKNTLKTAEATTRGKKLGKKALKKEDEESSEYEEASSSGTE